MTTEKHKAKLPLVHMTEISLTLGKQSIGVDLARRAISLCSAPTI